ncbi:MAG: S1C family serine protease [Patescibacteria group bacterium]|nr:S1C family serine protease [Patescibacteria group bacterium]
MEIEPTPTSPKNKRLKELDKLYHDKSLTEIHRPPPKSGRLFIILLAVIVGVFSGFFGGYFFYNFFTDQNTSQGTATVQTNRQTEIDSNKLSDLAEQSQAGLVGIFKKQTNQSAADPRASLYHPWEQLSTGLLVTSDGWVVVPKWATPDLQQVYVAVTSSGEVYAVEKIMADPATSLYFLKINGKNFTVNKFATRDKIAAGQEIFLIKKNSGALPMLWPTKLIQKYQPDASRADEYYQSSDTSNEHWLIKDPVAAQYQGSVVINASSEIVGIVASADWPTNQMVPADQIQSGLNSLLKNNQVVRPLLGVYYLDLGRAENVASLFSQNKKNGALIYGDLEANQPAVLTNSPAEKAGLAKGDIILKVGSLSVDETNNLTNLILSYSAGDSVKLEVLRDTEVKTIEVTLGTQK